MSERMSQFAMALKDHQREHSTPPDYLVENPDKKWHESFDDQQLRNKVAESIMLVLVQHQKVLSGNEREVKDLTNQLNDFLLPDLKYLREIGRLPWGLEDFDPVKAFALPAKKKRKKQRR
jgi:hypothetical protein